VNVERGDIVEIEEQFDDSYKALSIFRENGWANGGIPAVVLDVFEDALRVKYQRGGQIQQNTVKKPSDTDIEEGSTIELTQVLTFKRTLDQEAIEFTNKPSNTEELSDPLSDPRDPEDFRDPTYKEVSYDDVAGLEDVKKIIKRLVELPLDSDKQKDTSIDFQSGILFHGPPGTGKTMMAKAVAKETEEDVAFYNINGPEITNKYLGESPKLLRNIFESAKSNSQPSIIFIDELDSLAPNRSQESHNADNRIVGTLLTEMDGLENEEDENPIIVIGATNRRSDIDHALRRPGRFGEEIGFHGVEYESKLKIMKKKAEELNINEKASLEKLARETGVLTGAHIHEIFRRAELIRLDSNRAEISQEDLDIALERVSKQIENYREDYINKGEENGDI